MQVDDEPQRVQRLALDLRAGEAPTCLCSTAGEGRFCLAVGTSRGQVQLLASSSDDGGDDVPLSVTGSVAPKGGCVAALLACRLTGMADCDVLVAHASGVSVVCDAQVVGRISLDAVAFLAAARDCCGNPFAVAASLDGTLSVLDAHMAVCAWRLDDTACTPPAPLSALCITTLAAAGACYVLACAGRVLHVCTLQGTLVARLALPALGTCLAGLTHGSRTLAAVVACDDGGVYGVDLANGELCLLLQSAAVRTCVLVAGEAPLRLVLAGARRELGWWEATGGAERALCALDDWPVALCWGRTRADARREIVALDSAGALMALVL